jgi:acetyl esterase/lipase
MSARLDPQAKRSRAHPVIRHYEPPAGLKESITAAIMRGALRVTLKPFLGPPWPFAIQRFALANGSMFMPQDGRAQVKKVQMANYPAERITLKNGPKARHAILYLHGGAFVCGSPRTHRSITRRLCALTGAEVLAPDYRLAPESRFPTQINDCLDAYKQLLADGYAPDRIAIAGDSAGGNLTLMTAKAIELAGLPAPAALVMMSPVISNHPLPDNTLAEREHRDPMIRIAWALDIERALLVDPQHPLADPMKQDFSRLPPSMIQVGDDEVLFDNSAWLVEAVTRAGAHCELEVYLKRWHVFQAHAGLMPSSDKALERQAEFMKQHWAR